MRDLVATLVVAALLGSGCAARGCPNTIEGIRSDAFLESLPPDALVGVGRIVRFVPSPDAEFRGYDVEIETRVAGFEPEDLVMFVRVTDRIPGVDAAARVVVIGVRGDLRAVLAPAGCPIVEPLESGTSDGA